MGAPFYQWKKFIQKHDVKVFSSNYELYGDMSQRVMSTLQYFCPDLEIYSIDEAFLNLDSFSHINLTEFVLNIRNKVKQWTGIPVSIGFAPSKTLAKVANKIAKKFTQEGVFDLTNKSKQNKVLRDFPIEDIWGIGSRISKKLNKFNIKTACELRDADEKFLRSHFSIVLARTIMELRGISCIPLEEFQPKKQIMSYLNYHLGSVKVLLMHYLK